MAAEPLLPSAVATSSSAPTETPVTVVEFPLVVLSVAFGLGHVLQGRDAGIATGLLGLMWAVMYVRRRSSVAPVVSHAGFNSLEIVRIAVGDAMA